MSLPKRSLQLLSWPVGALGLLLVSTASATTYRLQASSGLPHSDLATIKALHDITYLSLVDSRSVTVTDFTDALPDGRVWITPIPIDATNTSWTIRQHTSPGSGSIKTNICVFDSAGEYLGCSPAVASDGASASRAVPQSGTAFAKSRLMWPSDCLVSRNCEAPVLHAVTASSN